MMEIQILPIENKPMVIVEGESNIQIGYEQLPVHKRSGNSIFTIKADEPGWHT